MRVRSCHVAELAKGRLKRKPVRSHAAKLCSGVWHARQCALKDIVLRLVSKVADRWWGAGPVEILEFLFEQFFERLSRLDELRLD